MPSIKLITGGTLLYDEEDWFLIAFQNWREDTNGYVSAPEKIKGVWTRVLFHRKLLKPPVDKVIDHIDKNKLNNQKSNLRICTHADNMRYRDKLTSSSSKYKGVTFDKLTGKWAAYITINKVQINLGKYKTELEAAFVYNNKAKELFREFAFIPNL